MNKIEKLIDELCPDGVEFKELGQVTAWDKRFNGIEKKKQTRVIKYPYVSANHFKDIAHKTGDVRLLSTGNYIGWTTEKLAGKNLCDGEIVAIPWGGRANIKYFKGKFVTADNRIATSLDTNLLLNKFLYYWMLVNNRLIESFYRGSGIKHPSMKKVLEFKIPIPPLPIQEEIVKILDNFTELEAELEAELKARKKQYEYYIELIFSNKESVNRMDLSELLIPKGYIRGPFGSALVKADMVNEGVPVYEQQHAIYDHRNFRYFIAKEKADKLNRFKVKNGDLVISCSGTVGKISIINSNDVEGVINQALLILRLNQNKVLPTYIKYYFESFKGYNSIVSNTNKSAQINISKRKDIEKIKIPIPPLSVQEKIVKTLDKFDALVNDISIGLPAEIKARQQQYEYYREKLLTFKEKK